MHRRDLLRGLIASCVASALPSTILSASTVPPWRNWSGNQSCNPEQRFGPKSIDELVAWLRQKHKTNAQGNQIRAVGAGHSFSPLVPTNDALVSTNYLRGVSKTPGAEHQADILSGTTLSEIGPRLAALGQALSNMPDIDRQTIAGAISTATHGTGRDLKCLSAYVDELDLVTASGELLTCNRTQESDIFHAARVGLGSIGIITRVRMQNEAPFRLKRLANWHSYEEGMAIALDQSKAHRNYEFYVIPFTGMILSDALDETQDQPSVKDEINSNDGLMDLKAARDYLGWSNKFRELVLSSYMKTLNSESNVDHSYQIYATERNVRFNEMEYHLPVEFGLQALDEIKLLIERKFPEVFFPIECRFVKADDCWLSPFYQRDSISIAVHRYFEEDYTSLFDAIEPIFQKYQGRPHWGKINTFTAQQFAEAYPMFANFKQVRTSLDPQNQFLNPYLKGILTS
jgi:FAD-linked oxidoreductase